MPSRILGLENPLRRYAWGSPTALPRLLGRPNPGGEPWAELWIGAHPLAPSEAIGARGRRPLDELIEAHPDAILGPEVAARFGGRLPFLAKLLAAAQPLSLQCHPDGLQALAGFAREEAAGIPLDAPQRCYRDPYAKPELICALTPFVALKGFRAVPEILSAFARVPSLAPERAALESSPGAEGLARFFSAVMSLPPERRDAALDEAIRVARAAGGEDGACLLQLADRYPGDIGVLAPLWLNRVVLAPGEALFLPAGELHSYLEGMVLEVMGSSDNVLRGGLTPKHLDVPELLRVLSFRSGPAEVLRPRPEGEGLARYDAPAAEFALTRIDLAGAPFAPGGRRGVEVLVLIEGEASVSSGDERMTLAPGAAVLAPAWAGDYALRGEGLLYRVEVGAAALTR